MWRTRSDCSRVRPLSCGRHSVRADNASDGGAHENHWGTDGARVEGLERSAGLGSDRSAGNRRSRVAAERSADMFPPVDLQVHGVPTPHQAMPLTAATAQIAAGLAPIKATAPAPGPLLDLRW